MEKYYLVQNNNSHSNFKKCETYEEAMNYAEAVVSQSKVATVVIFESIAVAKRKEVPVIIEPITNERRTPQGEF